MYLSTEIKQNKVIYIICIVYYIYLVSTKVQKTREPVCILFFL